MPTYSYRCYDCENAFDIHQAFTDDSLSECPSCDGRLRKVFSAIGVTFNGSGFYRTDSRSGSGSIPAGKSSGGSSSSGEGTSKKESSSSGGSAKKESSPATSVSAT